ncbi:MAG: anti-sigma factor antagonist [Thermoleophilaceae bacterium]|jgi:anti-anti-sigma factor|nr:anti-sigma factor antagonist [Thermoleophilaceae bacterium]
MAPEPFSIERVDDTVQVHLKLRGDLDLYTAPEFDDALVAVEGEKWPTIVLDMRELNFLDSMALRLVMRTQARAEQDGRRVIIVRGPEFLDRVLELAGLAEHLELADEPPTLPPAPA